MNLALPTAAFTSPSANFGPLSEETEEILHKSQHARQAGRYAKLLLLERAIQLESEQLLNSLTAEEIRKIRELIEVKDLKVAPQLFEEQDEDEVPDFFSVKDVAELTGLTPQQVRRNCINGKFTATQVAGENSSWRIEPFQFNGLPNWGKFLQQRKEKFQRTREAAELGKRLWEENRNVVDVEEQ